MKLVINKCYGGFSISAAAALWLYKRGFNEEDFKTPVNEYFSSTGTSSYNLESSLIQWRKFLADPPANKNRLFITVFSPDERYVLNTRPTNRSHPLLIECVQTLRREADGPCAKLEIVDIPDDVGDNWHLDDYDGIESVHENHRTW